MDLVASLPSQEPHGSLTQNQSCTLSPGETSRDPLELMVQDKGEMYGDASLCGLALGTGLGIYDVCRMNDI